MFSRSAVFAFLKYLFRPPQLFFMTVKTYQMVTGALSVLIFIGWLALFADFSRWSGIWIVDHVVPFSRLFPQEIQQGIVYIIAVIHVAFMLYLGLAQYRLYELLVLDKMTEFFVNLALYHALSRRYILEMSVLDFLMYPPGYGFPDPHTDDNDKEVAKIGNERYRRMDGYLPKKFSDYLVWQVELYEKHPNSVCYLSKKITPYGPEEHRRAFDKARRFVRRRSRAGGIYPTPRTEVAPVKVAMPTHIENLQRDGAVVEFEGKYWGIQYQSHKQVEYDFGPIVNATIRDYSPDIKPQDFAFSSRHWEKLKKGRVLPITVNTVYMVDEKA